MKSELSVQTGGQSAVIMMDIAKCYESVSPKKLLAAALRLKYPLSLLRCSINSYRWGRHLCFDSLITSRCIAPMRGIGAGSPFRHLRDRPVHLGVP